MPFSFSSATVADASFLTSSSWFWPRWWDGDETAEIDVDLHYAELDKDTFNFYPDQNADYPPEDVAVRPTHLLSFSALQRTETACAGEAKVFQEIVLPLQ